MGTQICNLLKIWRTTRGQGKGPNTMKQKYLRESSCFIEKKAQRDFLMVVSLSGGICACKACANQMCYRSC